MNTIRQYIAAQLIRLSKWVQPSPNAGPIGEDPK